MTRQNPRAAAHTSHPDSTGTTGQPPPALRHPARQSPQGRPSQGTHRSREQYTRTTATGCWNGREETVLLEVATPLGSHPPRVVDHRLPSRLTTTPPTSRAIYHAKSTIVREYRTESIES